MRLLAFNFFFLVGFSLLAQSYHPVITPGKQFSIYWDCSPCMTWYGSSQYYFDGDTTINGQVYQKLWGITTSFFPAFNAKDSLYIAALLREDTVNRKVYKYYGLPQDANDSLHYGGEHLLFDFDLDVGDTLQAYIHKPDIYGDFIVISKTKIALFNGDSVTAFTTTSQYISVLLFTEGILNSYIPFDLSLPWFSPYYKCIFGKNATPLYGNSCDSTRYIGLAEQKVLGKNLIRVYPNPAKNLLTIEHLNQSGTFTIYDLKGQLLLDADLDISESTISITHLTAGMYVWIIKTAKGIEIGKLVIEK